MKGGSGIDDVHLFELKGVLDVDDRAKIKP